MNQTLIKHTETCEEYLKNIQVEEKIIQDKFLND